MAGEKGQAERAHSRNGRPFDPCRSRTRIAACPDYVSPDGMWDAFSARFPYQETDDQLRAIEDVIADLDVGHPMDRLICGDVGFGKTEVAMRAALLRRCQAVRLP